MAPLRPTCAYLAPGAASMRPPMDLHQISMHFDGQGGIPELAGGRGDDPLWGPGNIAFGTLNVNILMCLLTFGVWGACGPRQ